MKVYEIISKDILDEGIIKSGAKLTKEGIMAIIKYAPSLSIGLAMTEPLYYYLTKMWNADKALASGGWDQARYDAYRLQEANVLTTTIGADLGIKWGSDIGFAMAEVILKRIPILGPLLGILSKIKIANKTLGGVVGGAAKMAKKSAQAFFMDSLNNKEGMNAISTILVSTITPGQKLIEAIEYVKTKINEAIAYAKGDDQPIAYANTAATTPKVNAVSDNKSQIGPHGAPMVGFNW